MDIIETLKAEHERELAFCEEALKYAKKTTRVNAIKRDIAFHKWILSFERVCVDEDLIDFL